LASSNVAHQSIEQCLVAGRSVLRKASIVFPAIRDDWRCGHVKREERPSVVLGHLFKERSAWLDFARLKRLQAMSRRETFGGTEAELSTRLV
jgi:hypothetical protein